MEAEWPVGGILLIAGQTNLMTVSATFLMGWIGTLLLLTIQAGLSDAHGARRGIALTEANIAASLCASLAPLLVGEFQRAGVGWRAAIGVAIALWGMTAIRYFTLLIPEHRQNEHAVQSSHESLPRRFWAFWLVISLCVAVEWSMGYWGATFLEDVVRLNQTDASTSMTAFFGAVVLGRIAGSRLARRYDSRRLLLAAMLLSIVGFPLFWLGATPMINLIGLFIVGLGIANQFPLALTVAMGVDPARAEVISARVSMASGVAILIAPQLLGVIADQSTLLHAYGAVGIILIVATVTAAVATGARRREIFRTLG